MRLWRASPTAKHFGHARDESVDTSILMADGWALLLRKAKPTVLESHLIGIVDLSDLHVGVSSRY